METVTLAAVLVALVELIKDLMPSAYRKYTPALAVVVGVVLNVYYFSSYEVSVVLGGLVLGLTATGLYKAADKVLS